MTVDTDGTYLVRNGTPYSLHSEFVSIKLDNSLQRSQDLLFAFPKLYSNFHFIKLCVCLVMKNSEIAVSSISKSKLTGVPFVTMTGCELLTLII